MGNRNSSEVAETDKGENPGKDEAQRPIQRPGKDQETGSGNRVMGKLLPDSPGQEGDAKAGRNGTHPDQDRIMEAMENAFNTSEEPEKAGSNHEPGLHMGKQQLGLQPDGTQPGNVQNG